MMPAAGQFYASGSVDPEYIAYLKRKLEVEERLALAIGDYLTVQTRYAIEIAERGPSSMSPFVPSDEMLIEVSKKIAALEAQIEQLTEAVNDPNDITGGALPVMYRTVIIPQLQSQLEDARKNQSWMQAQLEAAKKAEQTDNVPSAETPVQRKTEEYHTGGLTNG